MHANEGVLCLAGWIGAVTKAGVARPSHSAVVQDDEASGAAWSRGLCVRHRFRWMEAMTSDDVVLLFGIVISCEVHRVRRDASLRFVRKRGSNVGEQVEGARSRLGLSQAGLHVAQQRPGLAYDCVLGRDLFVRSIRPSSDRSVRSIRPWYARSWAGERAKIRSK
jgi:hypothetical protein